MRIAICLSGQPRTWRHTRDSLLAFFAGHELDLFLHTWAEGDPAELEAVRAAYAPRGWRFDERPLFVEEKRALAERFPAGPPLPIFDMFHSVAESLALPGEAGGGYDLIVRARFDALFDGRWDGAVPALGGPVLPDLYPASWGCTDQFALGSAADMALYAGMSDWLRRGDYPAYPEPRLQPERVMRDYLEKACGLRLDLRPIAMKLLRADQAGRAYAEVVDDPVFHAAKHEEWEAFAYAQFPDVAARADFGHLGRTALQLERALAAWLETRPAADGVWLLRAPWAERILAVDAFIAEQAGGALTALDAGAYAGLRLVCAMLLQKMDPAEAMTLESWVVHALSANTADMQRAHDWVADNAGELDRLGEVVERLGPLTLALTHANPLEQAGIGAWRPR